MFSGARAWSALQLLYTGGLCLGTQWGYPVGYQSAVVPDCQFPTGIAIPGAWRVVYYNSFRSRP